VALDAYRRDCGCSTGGAFSLLAIAGVLAWRGWSLAQGGTVTAGAGVVALLVALGAGILMGGVGKAVGLARARARFRRAVARLVDRIGERSPDVA
jgi:predicted phage tail protein